MTAVALGISGASGIAYGLRLAQALMDAQVVVHLMMTGAAFRVLRHEADIELDPQAPDLGRLFADTTRLRWHPLAAVEAAPASGSAGLTATVVCPCSTGTLARIAHGLSRNLLERAADVALKEGRPLVLVPRETPYSAIHLRNMLTLARAGAVILPASPGFYHRPRTVADLVDFVVGKILDRLRIESPLIRRWSTPPGSVRS